MDELILLKSKLAELIDDYEKEKDAHASGIMMSMAESIHGELWCKRILKDLRAL
jgi:hypothetical protein